MGYGIDAVEIHAFLRHCCVVEVHGVGIAGPPDVVDEGDYLVVDKVFDERGPLWIEGGAGVAAGVGEFFKEDAFGSEVMCDEHASCSQIVAQGVGNVTIELCNGGEEGVPAGGVQCGVVGGEGDVNGLQWCDGDGIVVELGGCSRLERKNVDVHAGDGGCTDVSYGEGNGGCIPLGIPGFVDREVF